MSNFSRTSFVSLGLCLASLAAGPPAIAAPPEAELGPTFLVNQVARGRQAAPDTAVRPDGGLVVAWWESFPGPGVGARVFHADGSPVGDQIMVQPDTTGSNLVTLHSPPTLAADRAGRFAVIWDEASSRLHGRRFDADGRPDGPLFAVPRSLERRPEDPATAFDPQGRLWVAWVENRDFENAAVVQVFGPDGETLATELDLGRALFGSSDALAIAAAPDGSVLVAWHGLSGERVSLVARLFRPDLTHGPLLDLTPGSETEPLNPALSAGPDGFALAWQDRDDVFLRLLDSSVRPIGPRRTLAEGYSPSVAHDGAGNVLVSWTHVTEGNRTRILGRCFDPGGRPLGGEIALSTDTRFSADSSDVAGVASGGFFVVWASEYGDGEASAILARQVRPSTPGIVGLSTGAYHAVEGGGAAEVSVLRTAGSAGAVSVGYRVRGESAVAGQDFEATTGRLEWADGDTGPRSFPVPLLGDARREGEERALVELFGPAGGALLGRSEAALVIADDDGLARPGAASMQLTAAQVECDRARLVGLAERFDGFDRGLNLALTATGDPFGVLYYSDDDERVDVLLSFSANAEETPLLRNPARPQLPSVSLTRNELASTLIERALRDDLRRDPSFLQVVLDPTAGGGGPQAGLLKVDNALQPDTVYGGGHSTDTKPGRGLLPLLDSCHDRLTGADVHVLRILTRIVRASTGFRQDFIRTVIYRGEEPGHYRIEALAHRATMELDLLVTFDADGALLTGTLVARPPCPPGLERGCSRVDGYLSVRLAPPLGPPGAIDFRYWLLIDPDAVLGASEVEIDWRELLAGSTWRTP